VCPAYVVGHFNQKGEFTTSIIDDVKFGEDVLVEDIDAMRSKSKSCGSSEEQPGKDGVDEESPTRGAPKKMSTPSKTEGRRARTNELKRTR
jgi:hypothetical protein